MSIEDRVRASLRTAAGRANPTTEDWDKVVAGARVVHRRRGTQRVAAAGLSIAVIVAAVAGLLWLPDSEEEGRILGRGGAWPPAIVTFERDGEGGRIVLRSSDDGAEVREIANVNQNEFPGVSVSPDGSSVYFTRSADSPCDLDYEVVRVSIEGGEPEHVAWGADPAVSPSGRRLMYASDDNRVTGDSRPECGGLMLVLHEPSSGYTRLSEEIRTAHIDLSWSSNGENIMYFSEPGERNPNNLEPGYEYVSGGGGDSDVHGVVLGTIPGLAEALGKDAALTLVEQGNSKVLAVTDTDGLKVRERLFGGIREMRTFNADRSGKFVVFSASFDDGDGLGVWSRESGREMLLESDSILDVAWVPTSTAPREFVAVSDEGRLEVRRTADGSVVRVLLEGIDVSHGTPRLAVTPDAQYVLVDRYEVEPCTDNPGGIRQRIALVSITSGEVDGVVDGAAPAIGSVDHHVAYVTSSPRARCGEHDILVTRALPRRNDPWPQQPTPGTPEKRFPVNLDDRSWTVALPYWSNDHRTLHVTLDEGARESYRSIDTVEPFGADLVPRPPTREHLVEAGEATIPEPYVPVAWLGHSEALGARESATDGAELVAIATSGSVRSLTRIEGTAVAAGTVNLDHYGKHIILAALDSTDTEGNATLYRFEVGAIEPVKLAEGVLSAAWIDPRRDSRVIGE